MPPTSPQVNALQETVHPDLAEQLGQTPPSTDRPHVPDLGPRPHYDGDLAYFQTLADLLTENPPPPGNEAAVELLSRGGITVGKPMDVDALSEPTRRGWRGPRPTARRS